MGSERLWRLFLRGAESVPAEPALQAGEFRLTYAQLRTRALHLAERLGGAEPPGIVVLQAERRPGTYVAYLAAAALGAVIVPVDPATPPRRLADILGDLGAGTIVTDREPPPGHERTWRVLRLDRDEDRDDDRITDAAIPQAPAVTLPAPPAYIMFTSGSTGKPKGVPVPGNAVESYVDTVGRLVDLGPGDRHSQVFSLAFDLSVHDMFVSWSRGATLVPPSDRAHQLMGRYVADGALSHWFSVPSSIDLATRAGRLAPPDGEPKTLRWAGFCGEPLTYDQVGRVRDGHPGASIWNLYGPTELTIACAAYRLPEQPADDVATSNGTVPIGTLFDTVEGRLRNPADSDAATETTGNTEAAGELMVRGAQRFAGYLDERHNAPAFVAAGGANANGHARGPIPADAWYRTGDLVEDIGGGVLLHRGRFDDQIKIAGHRIELREIEAHLRGLPAVDEAAVVDARMPGASGGSALVAFYIGHEEQPRELAAQLAALLPPYMIPRRFTRVSSFPLNANGKIDRPALRARVADGVTQPG